METFDFRGLGVALITPFSETTGQVDFDRLRFLVDRLVTAGTDYIVVMGTTAETPTLTVEEKINVLKSVAEVAAGRVPLVLGFGGNCTRSLCEQLAAWDGNGYDAILSVTPFYNKPSQRGLYEHFKAVAEASPLPVILYNVPGRTGVNMLPETVARLAEDVPGIIGVKEASGNLAQVADLTSSLPHRFAVISGDDGLTVEMAQLGAKGVISVIGNALPSYWSRLTHLALEGKAEEAKAMERELAPLLRMLFAEGNPAGIKALMACMNLCNNTLRLPLVTVSSKLENDIKLFIEAHTGLNR